jgi:hypothetical protein
MIEAIVWWLLPYQKVMPHSKCWGCFLCHHLTMARSRSSQPRALLVLTMIVDQCLWPRLVAGRAEMTNALSNKQVVATILGCF